MDKEQYIQSLKEQGYSIVDIMRMVEEKFPETVEQPKKIEDPVKTETSMGSFLDMVSKSEDGSSELSETEDQLPSFLQTKKEKTETDEIIADVFDSSKIGTFREREKERQEERLSLEQTFKRYGITEEEQPTVEAINEIL